MKKILGLVVMFMSNIAFANVVIHDNAGVISSTQQSALVAGAARWPFDLHVLTGAYPNPAALDSAVHRCVTGPNVVCIGIDPVHHKTNVHLGTNVGVPSTDYPMIASAGNSSFKTGDYQGGIEAIAERARSFAHTLRTTTPSTGYTVQPTVQVHIDNPVPTGMTTGWWLFAIFMGVFVFAGIFVLLRARKTVKKINDDMNDFRDEAFEMSSRNMEERDWHEKMKTKQTTGKHPMTPVATPAAIKPATTITTAAPVTTPATPTTVVHNHISGNAGVSGTDLLLGYELGRLTTPTVVVPTTQVVREVIREPANDNGGASSSWKDDDKNDDAGGSSSSWSSKSDDDDSSSSSSSSWDSGSSSDSGSSWDSGGGDSGGGSDSGGGGSDW